MEVAHKRGILYLAGAPITAAELRSLNLIAITEVLERRPNPMLRQITLLTLEGDHWTVAHFRLAYKEPGDGDLLLILNSLPPSEPGDIPQLNWDKLRNEVELAYYLREHRHLQEPPEARTFKFDRRYLDLQHDGFSCGFWAVFLAFSLLFGIDFNGPIVHSMTVDNLKETLGTIYSAFVGNPVGVPTSLLREILSPFEPTSALLQSIESEFIAIRPAGIEQVVDVIKSTQSLPQPPMTLANLVDIRLGEREKVHWVCGEHLPTALEFHDLDRGGHISDSLVNAYLALLVRDTANIAGHIVIMDSSVGDEMAIVPKDAIRGLVPPKKMASNFWLPETDMFLLEYLLIPWNWGNRTTKQRNWILVVVDFQQCLIKICDSEFGGGSILRRRNAVYTRVWAMLCYEHQARKSGAKLSTAWAKNPPKDAITIPFHSDEQNAAMYLIYYASCFVNGATDELLWKYSEAAATKDRQVIGQRLAIEIASDKREPNLRHLQVLGQPQAATADEPSRTPFQDSDDAIQAEYIALKSALPLLRSTTRVRLLECELADQALAERLHGSIPIITDALLRVNTFQGPECFTQARDAFDKAARPASFYEQQLGNGRGAEPFCAGDEEALGLLERTLEAELDRVWGSRVRDAYESPSLLAQGPGRFMLAITMASFYLHTGLDEAHALLRARQVYRPPTETVFVWELYCRSLADPTEADVQQLANSHMIVEPGLEVAVPQRRPQ
ncbi:hypothetical protein C8J57DRAFT_1541161 [Mycena rebaudengoi]|nr:hypothetical protein C8J57DRAFT_1541161 [Mycena rebaudengoi]